MRTHWPAGHHAARPVRRPSAQAAAALTLVGLLGVPGFARSATPDADARIDAFVERSLEEHGTPGLALAVTDRDRLVRVATYGFADAKQRRPVEPGTLFEIGSISKSFTVAALMHLREEGRFDPRAPVTAYLPWFSVHSSYRPITSHDLFTHSSGLPADRDDIPSSLYQAVAVREREVGSAPGTIHAYSNVGYQVLGALLEEIEGRPYPDVIRDRVLRRVGMDDSEPAFTHADRPRLATGYTTLYDDRPWRRAHPLVEATWLEYGAGDGSVIATAADLAAYLRVWLNRGALGDPGKERLVSEESFAMMIADPGVPGDGDPDDSGVEQGHYGYALDVTRAHGHTLIGHSGGMVGYTSMMLGDLEHGLGVVVFVNGPGEPGTVARDALAVLVAASDGSELPALPAPPGVERPDDYTGRFVARDGRTWTVAAPDGSLRLSADGIDVALTPGGRDWFVAETDDPRLALFPIRFEREAPPADAGHPVGAAPAGASEPVLPGHVVALVHGAERLRLEGAAPAVAAEAPAAWRAYPGHYRTTHAWFNNLRIVLREGGLWLVEPGGGEQALSELEPGAFRVGDEHSAERLRLHSVVRGLAQRANLSGVDYYRSFVP